MIFKISSLLHSSLFSCWGHFECWISIKEWKWNKNELRISYKRKLQTYYDQLLCLSSFHLLTEEKNCRKIFRSLINAFQVTECFAFVVTQSFDLLYTFLNNLPKKRSVYSLLLSLIFFLYDLYIRATQRSNSNSWTQYQFETIYSELFLLNTEIDLRIKSKIFNVDCNCGKMKSSK